MNEGNNQMERPSIGAEFISFIQQANLLTCVLTSQKISPHILSLSLSQTGEVTRQLENVMVENEMYKNKNSNSKEPLLILNIYR